jgi:hypothetical protein
MVHAIRRWPKHSNHARKDRIMSVIVIRHDEYDILVVARIPDDSDAETIFTRWLTDQYDGEYFDEDDLADAYWEELEVLDLV